MSACEIRLDEDIKLDHSLVLSIIEKVFDESIEEVERYQEHVEFLKVYKEVFLDEFDIILQAKLRELGK